MNLINVVPLESITGRQKRDVSNETSEPSSTTESQPSNTSGHKSGARSLDECK